MSSYRVALSGDVDLSREAELDDHAKAFSEHAGVDVEVDLHGVTFFDSTALALLVRLHQTASARGGTVTLLNVPPRCMRVLDITDTARMFNIPDEASHAVPTYRTSASVTQRTDAL